MNGDHPGPGILRLTVELFMLPVRTFLHGMERMVATLKDIQRATDRGAHSFLSGSAQGDHHPPAAPWPAAVKPVAWTATADIGHTETFEEPPTAGGARDGAGEQPSKEDRRMYTDQDLSGDMVKVVQYSIVSVLTTADDEAFIIIPMGIRAFANDMTAEDFTSWMIAENQPAIKKWDQDWQGSREHFGPIGTSPISTKYLRVAFSVIGRFSPADINWDELQARSVARIAANFPPLGLPAVEGSKTSKSTKGDS